MSRRFLNAALYLRLKDYRFLMKGIITIMRINDIGLNNRFGSEFEINRPLWTRDYLFLHFLTPVTVLLDGREEYAEAGSVIIYHVGTPQYYHANQDTYSDDYIHFFVEDDYSYITDLGIPFNKIIKLPRMRMLSRLLNDLQYEYLSSHKNKESSVDLMMKLLFNRISEFVNVDVKDNNYYTYYDILHKLRTNIYTNPEKNWTVIDMAKFCNLSSSYLQILYKQAFHTTCINDVINSKLQLAKSLLTMTNYTVKEVAMQCGYHNVEYFMRLFKKCTRYTPSQYRELDLLNRV